MLQAQLITADKETTEKHTIQGDLVQEKYNCRRERECFMKSIISYFSLFTC